MADTTRTLDLLWEKLGLDSLPGDVGSAEDLRSTRQVDWNVETLKVARENPTERLDLPRISITPPAVSTEVERLHQDLVVVGVLGEGGMGKVLLSRQHSLGRDVAVKIARTDASTGALQALVHEARTTGALEHPGVIPVYALASDAAGRPALVMKRVDGVSWGRLLYDTHDPAWERLTHKGASRLERHVDILLHVCNAIAFAHSRGVLHRDIKPSNVLIGEFGEVYVADWGVATRKPKPGEHRKASLVGTPVYMPPEMVGADDTEMDERTDVFLLGATLFEVLAGKPPFGGATLRDVLASALEGRREPMPDAAPRELVDVCNRAMAPLREDRFQTVTELRDALVAWMHHRGSATIAEAAQERLEQLKATLASGSKDRGEIVPLLSECRFGFGQALREWPGNEQARDGLRDSILAAARFEASQGNLEAVRSLCKELEQLPQDLTDAIGRLEEAARHHAAREARMMKLEKEMDPTISGRQRLRFFVSMAIATVILVFATRTATPVRTWLVALGAFYPAAVMVLYLSAYVFGLWVGRKSLLATRLNRRAAGVVGLAIAGPLLNRFAAAFTGATPSQAIVGDLIITATMATATGLMLHWGFFVCAGIYLAGAVVAVIFPSIASGVHGLAAVLSIGGVLATWNRWRNEYRFSKLDG